jgi:hypothetical protein
MKSVEQLDVFKLSHELALMIYKVTIRFSLWGGSNFLVPDEHEHELRARHAFD